MNLRRTTMLLGSTVFLSVGGVAFAAQTDAPMQTGSSAAQGSASSQNAASQDRSSSAYGDASRHDDASSQPGYASSPQAGNSMEKAPSMHQAATHASDFLKKVASGSQAEVQISKLALQKSSNPQLKQVAQRLIEDHSQVDQQLARIAQRENVALPIQPMPEDQAKLARLEGKSGKDFDQAWIQMNRKDHRKDIKLFSMAGNKLDDTATRQFAQSTLPKLKTHMQLIEQLQHGNAQANLDNGD